MQRGAATLAEVPVTKDTIVVRVDEVVQGPELVQGYQGQPVTVQLEPGEKIVEGGQYVFRTQGWMFGSSLAVRSVGVSAALEGAVQKMHAALSAKPSQALKERADQAELIVSGQVTRVRQVPREPGTPITEHDPEWQEAVVRVDHLARGSRKRGAGKDVVIRFAASPDVRWAEAPKFSVGAEGVWMLGNKRAEHAEMRAAAAVPKEHYLVVDPEDFHPKEEVSAVLSQIE